jgi:hypothetical protein
VQKVEKLKALCLQYATSIKLLMPSIEVANSENTLKSEKSRSRTNKSQERDQQLKLASENVVMSESILYVSCTYAYLAICKTAKVFMLKSHRKFHSII